MSVGQNANVSTDCLALPPPGPQVPDGGQAASVGLPAVSDGQWVRIADGVLQVKVILQGLQCSAQYNGSIGWVNQEHFSDEAQQQPKLLTVHLIEPERVVRVHSGHVFGLGPACEPRSSSTGLFTLVVRLHTPRGLVPIRALIDTGCELEGVINRQIVTRFELPLRQSGQRVRTASGQRISGVEQALIKTHFAPGCTRSIRYGVLDLPGFDAVLGLPFLERCTPYSLVGAANGKRELHLTWPGTARVVVFANAVSGPLQLEPLVEVPNSLAPDPSEHGSDHGI